MKYWYEELFQDYANSYEQEPLTNGTIGEVDFIEKEIGFDKDCRILGIGCGTGRHAIELATRGYSVVGVDLSAAQLDKARSIALKEKVSPRFLQADARALTFTSEFDLVTIIREGAFLWKLLSGFCPTISLVGARLVAEDCKRGRAQE
jgi:2-polyprenyl-3-methyl-5-hydroxy-6-metoxy-1,4-benzoquinol methylase